MATPEPGGPGRVWVLLDVEYGTAAEPHPGAWAYLFTSRAGAKAFAARELGMPLGQWTPAPRNPDSEKTPVTEAGYGRLYVTTPYGDDDDA